MASEPLPPAEGRDDDGRITQGTPEEMRALVARLEAEWADRDERAAWLAARGLPPTMTDDEVDEAMDDEACEAELESGTPDVDENYEDL